MLLRKDLFISGLLKLTLYHPYRQKSLCHWGVLRFLTVMSALLSLYRFLTQHISITTTISITMTLFSSTGQINSPGWILKSSRGTELAVWPMCCRISSSSPVGTQLMLFGSPSAVKKSTERDRQLHSSRNRKYSLKKLKLELLDYKGAIYLARGSQANV